MARYEGKIKQNQKKKLHQPRSIKIIFIFGLIELSWKTVIQMNALVFEFDKRWENDIEKIYRGMSLL